MPIDEFGGGAGGAEQKPRNEGDLEEVARPGEQVVKAAEFFDGEEVEEGVCKEGGGDEAPREDESFCRFAHDSHRV